MGYYNPHAPTILGQEWVGIRPEPYTLSIETEVGTDFTVIGETTTDRAYVYLAEEPARQITNQCMLVNIYPEGTVDKTGPIELAVIPVTGSAIAGSISFAGGATNAANALNYPTDGRHLLYTGSGTAILYFNTPAFNDTLAGKRILHVAVRYVLTGDVNAIDGVNSTIFIASGPEGVSFFPYANAGLVQSVGATMPTATGFARLSLGELNPWWNYPGGNWMTTMERLPWTNADIQKLAPNASNRYGIIFHTINPDAITLRLSYVALEVYYCTEQRIGYGAMAFGRNDYSGGPTLNPYILEDGPNQITIRDTNRVQGVDLTSGNYTCTVRLGDIGPLFTSGSAPKINALRELYPISSHRALKWSVPTIRSTTLRQRQVAISASVPRRLITSVDPQASETEVTDVLPHVILRRSDQTAVNGMHAYGTQFKASVWGSNILQQGLDSQLTIGGTYPLVRFYARTFGDTTIPLTVSYLPATGAAPIATAQLLPAQFNELSEIVDGWREVTLTFEPPPVVFASETDIPQIQWSALGLSEETQWQILAVDALGTSNLPQSNSTITYGDPRGRPIHLRTLVGTTVSPHYQVDATILLSQQSAPVTGLAVSTEVLSLTAVPTACDVSIACVPTSVSYNRVTWDPVSYATLLYADSFNRVDIDEWGQSSFGATWTDTGTGDAYVIGFAGVHYVDDLGNVMLSTIGSGISDGEISVLVSDFEQDYPDGAIERSIIARYVDANNYYRFTLSTVNAGSAITLTASITVVSGGSPTQLASQTYTYDSFQYSIMQVYLLGESLQFRVIPNTSFLGLGATDNQIIVSATDSTHTSGAVGLHTFMDLANTIGAYEILYEGFSATTISDTIVATFGYYELQRSDDVDPTWRTIAVTTSPVASEFNDYEARVGVESYYRMRTCNVLDFCGPWSDIVSNTISAPGVSPSGSSSVLIFTSNEVQDGSATLAYTESWRDSPVEVFEHPEAATQLLQRMYGKDYFTAFRPSERLGQRFSRTLLVQAAAVATPRLDTAFQELRDLTWDDLSYVCVRTEEGDRWLANVAVPSGNLSMNRKLQLAQVDIAQVTDTPTEVNITTCEGLVSRTTQVFAQTVYQNAFNVLSSEMIIDVHVTLDNWMIFTPVTTTLVANEYIDDEIMFLPLGYAFTVSTGGLLGFTIIDDTVIGQYLASEAINVDPGTSLWVRAHWRSDNGSGNSSTIFYTSVDGETWTQLGTEELDPENPTNVLTSVITVNKSNFTGFIGQDIVIHSVKIRAGDLTIIASPMFDEQPAGTQVFVDAQDNTWEIVGGGTCER